MAVDYPQILKGMLKGSPLHALATSRAFHISIFHLNQTEVKPVKSLG